MPAMLGTSGRNISGIKAPTFDGSQLCAQTDPEIFFPDELTDPRISLRYARQICDKCEFKNPCLEYALDNTELEGIWAGTTIQQRQDLRSIRRRTA